MGRKMQPMIQCEWFCANCFRMIDVLSKHGRCPYCDSNAVDLAYRAQMAGKAHAAEPRPEVVLSINL